MTQVRLPDLVSSGLPLDQGPAIAAVDTPAGQVRPPAAGLPRRDAGR